MPTSSQTADAAAALIAYLHKMDADSRERLPRDQQVPYHNMYDFVLRVGRPFPSTSLPAGVSYGGLKNCYTNATKLALDYPDQYAYVEGFASRPPRFSFSAHLHAWVIDRQGCAVDPTWRDAGAYFGVPFIHQYLDDVVLKTLSFGTLIDRWEDGRPLLSGQDPLDKAVLDLAAWLGT